MPLRSAGRLSDFIQEDGSSFRQFEANRFALTASEAPLYGRQLGAMRLAGIAPQLTLRRRERALRRCGWPCDESFRASTV